MVDSLESGAVDAELVVEDLVGVARVDATFVSETSYELVGDEGDVCESEPTLVDSVPPPVSPSREGEEVSVFPVLSASADSPTVVFVPAASPTKVTPPARTVLPLLVVSPAGQKVIL